MSQRILVLCGDQWHPAADVERGLAALAQSAFVFEFVADATDWSAEWLNEFPVVMVAKANHRHAQDSRPWLTRQTQGMFPDFVRRGGGLFLLHGGTCYKDLSELRAITGGAFLSHPEQCPVTFTPVKSHALTDGAAEFVSADEHYVMALDATDAEIFLTARSQHGVQPAGWTRREGRGRVCVLTPGHNLTVWLHPEFQKMLQGGLNWLATAN